MKSFPFLVSGALTALPVEMTHVLRAPQPREGGWRQRLLLPLTSHMSAWNRADTSRAFADARMWVWAQQTTHVPCF